MQNNQVCKNAHATQSGTHVASTLVDLLRNSWFLIVFVAGVIYWVARQDSVAMDIKKSESRISSLENRVGGLESGIATLSVKIDGIKEDVSMIKSAVLK